MPAFHPLRAAAVDRICADAVAVTFDVPDHLADRYTHRAGQHVTLRVRTGGVEERRQYSICSPVGGPLRIGVRRMAGGLFSDRILHRLRPGDVVEAGVPQGRFTLAERTLGGHHGFIAAGSGITPVLSIISTLLAGGTAGRASVIFGNRGAATVMFADELADLKDRYPDRLHLVHVLSRETGTTDLLSGRLDSRRIGSLLDRVVDAGGVDHWWLCGPHGVVEDAADVLAARGVPPEAVRRELFYVGDPPAPPVRHDGDPDGGAAAVTIVLAGRSTAVTVPAGTAILDAAVRARSDLPFACRSGVCGTCRARLTDGAVHQDRTFALGRYELADGFVLTCQAVPTTASVTVDYDA
nr:2Fe-2S iron-sulfur cluster-binding protein [Micromonospora sp. DSM 115978]